MTAKRTYIAMLVGIFVLVLLCAVGTYYANNLLKTEGDKLMVLKLEKAVLDRQGNALAQAKRDIAEYEDLEKISRSVVPQEKDQAETVLEIVKIAKDAGITLTSIDFPESKLGELLKKNAKSTKATGPTVDSKTTQLTEIPDLKGVYVMEIKVQSDKNKPISYSNLLNYLTMLEKNRRTAQVVDISIEPTVENRNAVTFSLVLNTYVRP